MDNLIYFLKENLYLNNFNILKTGKNKCVIFKVSYKYTKCIYIKIKDDIININVDKVFDSNYYNSNIERLLISQCVFSDYREILNYIQKNIDI